MEVEIKEEDLSLRVDHFWRKVFGGIDSCGDKFVVLLKMVKCALALCHSNADVERSLSVNKRMLTKMNTRMSEETINGLRSTKATVQESGHTSKVPITLDMVKSSTEFIQNVFSTYQKRTIEEENQRERKRTGWRTLDEMRQEEKRLHKKLEQLTSEHTAVEEAMQRTMGYVEEGGAMIKNVFAKQVMMELEAGYKLVEIGKVK